MERGVGPWRGGQRGEWRDPWSSSVLWDPFSYGGTTSDVGRHGGDRGDDTSALAHAHVDWRETDTAHIFVLISPLYFERGIMGSGKTSTGVRREDLKVQVEDDNILQISGERVKEQADQNDKWHRVERRRGSFSRRFRPPETANMDEIGCTLANGVLTVTVPKKETQPESRNVRQINVA